MDKLTKVRNHSIDVEPWIYFHVFQSWISFQNHQKIAYQMKLVGQLFENGFSYLMTYAEL